MASSLRHLARLAGLILLGASLLSCGGGGGTGTPAPAPLSTGVFTDAPTQGLHYYAYPSGREGYTDAAGHFDYRVGDIVTFRLQLGPGQTLKLGEFLPDDLEATVSVLSLRRGGLAAQLLQSLDHSADPTHLDVSGLALAAGDFDAIVDWYTSDGQTLPPGQSAQQMLAAAQAGASGSPAFTQPGAVSPSAAVTRAREVIDALINSSPESDAAAIVDDELVLHTGYSNYGPVAELIHFSSSTPQAFIISMNSDSTGDSTRYVGYNTDLNQVGFYDGDTLQLQGTLESGMTTFTDIDLPYSDVPRRGAGNYRVLVDTPIAVHNQMRTIRGYPACDYYNGTTFVFSADGQSWSAYCESANQLASGSVAAPQVIESGTVVNYLPNLLKLTNSCGVVHYIGVLDGSFSNGRLALLTPATAPDAVGRLDHGIVGQIGTSKAALLQPFTGSCAGAGEGTPVATWFTGATLSGTITGVAGLRARLRLYVDGHYYSFTDVQLPDDAASGPVLFHQMPDSGTYEVIVPPGCTVQDGSGEASDPGSFSVDCSNFAAGTVYAEQDGKTMLFGDDALPGAILLSNNTSFTLSLPPLPDNVPLQVCASVGVFLYTPGTPVSSAKCFAPGTGFALSPPPIPALGLPFYVVGNSTAHNHFDAAHRVTTATATTVHVQSLGYVSISSSTSFQIQVLADKNSNGVIDSGELWWTSVERPPVAPQQPH